MDGTVKEASLEVLAFDCAGAGGDKSLVSVGTIFDAMTMGCFKFDSTLDGLDIAIDFSIVLAGFTALTAKTGVSDFLATFLAGTSSALTGFAIGLITFLTTAFVAAFETDLGADLATVLIIGLLTDFAKTLTAGLAADFTTGFLTGLATVLTAALEAGLTGLTVFFATTLVATLAAFAGTFLTAFFATVFIHCLPAKLVFIQIKQSTHTH